MVIVGFNCLFKILHLVIEFNFSFIFVEGEDFLDELLSKDYWPSLLDGADASPSEILADAAPVLVPPISPVLSLNSSQSSGNCDSGSDDDSKK